jgi:hypothetical protein
MFAAAVVKALSGRIEENIAAASSAVTATSDTIAFLLIVWA